MTDRRMTRDKTRAKEKARAESPIHDGEGNEEDAYGSDDPEHRNPSQELDGQDGEVDDAPQGSPKGHKRSRLNSTGQGAPVQVKAEKIKSLFEPLVRDTDGCAVSSFPPSPSRSFPTQVMSQVPLSASNSTTS